MKLLRFNLFILILCFLCGCSGNYITLVDNVTQDTANMIILQLGQNDIPATKLQNKEKTFQVQVAKSNQLKALSVLNMNGSPSKQYNSIGEVFKKDSFISSPLEEQGRFIYALQQQIANMISQIDGVIDVECQVSLAPSSDNLWQNEQIKPAAAVFIKYKNGYRLDLYVNRIKQLVANSVPGLTSDRVEVLTMTPVIDK